MSQIFKKKIPTELLLELLTTCAFKHHKYLLFNNAAYKKGIFNNAIPLFIETCKEYYHISKFKYLEKKVTYNSFITILRQICNYNKITYTSQIKYDKSLYDITYYIYPGIGEFL